MRFWTLREAVAEALDRTADRPGPARAYPDTFLDVLEECGFTVVRSEVVGGE